MKKFTLIIVLLFSVNMMFAQSTATLSLPNVEVNNPGEISIPLELSAISSNPPNLIIGFQISFYYDASKLQWMGSDANPGAGISYINPALSPLGLNWQWNSLTGNLIFAWYDEPNYIGVSISPPSDLIRFRFQYLGGLMPGNSTPITFSLTLKTKDENNKEKVVNEMYNEYFEYFQLTLINGSLYSFMAPSTTLNAKMFLEGPYFNSQMTPFLNLFGYIPFSQPYNTALWNYNGTETVTAIPNANVVDWVLVELLKRYEGNEEYIFEVMERKAAFLLKNGDIKDLDGTSGLGFNDFDEPEFYVRIYHRNHLPLISTAPLTGTYGIYSYDFTTGPEKALGGTNVQKELKLNLWGVMTGDGIANKQIDNKDKNDLWLIENNLTGYFSGDYNMDSQVDDDDKAIKWKSNAGQGLPFVRDSIPPPDPWACGDPIVDLRDSQSYITVEIGNQCWMAENLNIGTRINGIGDQTDNAILEKYCYGDNEANCDTYGGLYQWNEMMQYINNQGAIGICPDGWHVPTDGEWSTLTTFLGGESVAGGKMKEAGYTHWNSPNTAATNESGFNGLPVGLREDNGVFDLQGNIALFWSSTDFESYGARDRRLAFNISDAIRYYSYKVYGISTRCIHGEYINQPPLIPYSPQPAEGSVNQPTTSILSWACTDPENDPLTYDVYFGTANPPSLISAGQTGTTYNPGTLGYSSTYYWKIITYDDHSNSIEGEVWSFTTENQPFICGEPLLDSRDGQSYNTVQIGEQCWMAENLNLGTMINGSSNQTQQTPEVIEKYCYDNNTANCDTYGGLYQWNEMMQYSTTPGVQGICPAGWHLPTDGEWTMLTTFLGGESVAGGKMKATGTIEAGTGLWNDPNTGATNESGFSALPGGYCYGGGIFYGMGDDAAFWSSTKGSAGSAWYRYLNCNYTDVYYGYGNEGYGFSSRCVQD